MIGLSTDSRRRESPGLEDARRVATAAIKNQTTATALSARAILDEQPWLHDYPSVVMDLAYEEFCQRVEQGEHIGVAEFSRRYPEIEDQLVRQLAIHELLVSAIPEGADRFRHPEVPGTFLHFDLLQELGRGGAATVYLARDRHMGDALRVLKVARTTARECVPLAQLSHLGIVFGLYREQAPYGDVETLCMPVIGRWTLHDVLEIVGQNLDLRRPAGTLWRQLAERDEIPLEWREPRLAYGDLRADSRTIGELIVDWARQVAEALAYAHAKGIIHCDIKPSNILIAWDGRAVVLDFNTAQAGDSSAAHGGTLPFMSPEQLTALSQAPASAATRLTYASDLFSWGATVYSLVTGYPPYPPGSTGGSRAEAIEQQLGQRRDGFHRQRLEQSRASRVLKDLIADCLESDPSRRPRSADEVVRRLQIERAIPRSPRSLRVRPLVALAVAAAVLGLGGIWAAGLFSPSVDRTLQRGWLAVEQRDYADAFQRFTAAAKRAPRRFDTRLGLAWTLIQQQQYDAALEHLEQLPTSVEVERLRAYALLAGKHNPDPAKAFYKRMIESRQATASDLCNAGYCQMRSKSLADRVTARQWLRDALLREPNQTPAWANLLYLDRHESLLHQQSPDENLIAEAVQQAGNSLAVWHEILLSQLAVGAYAEKHGTAETQAACHAMVNKALLRAADLGLTRESAEQAKSFWPGFCASSEFPAIAARLPSGSMQFVGDHLAAPQPLDLVSLRAAFSE